MRSPVSLREPTFLIIGAGFGGLGFAMQLVRRGVRSFTILEKGSDIGGTWRDNVYPGAACDVPSLLYCFSFEHKTDWSRRWAPQAEILEYQRACARKYALEPHLRLGTEVESARYDEDAAEWVVTTRAGETLRARYLVSAVGQLNRPALPSIHGLAGFHGTTCHSAAFPRDVELAGKQVAVIGNAASAVQLVPPVAEQAARLTVYQRSANWMIGKGDRPYTPVEHWLLRFIPLYGWLVRALLWVFFDSRVAFLSGGGLQARLTTWLARSHLERSVAEPELRRKLTPDYPVGAKRLLVSDEYYPAVQRPNVELVTDPIDHVEPDAIVTRDGTRRPAEVIVLATGFQSTAFLAPMKITGRAGRTLDEAWKDGAEAYFGIAVPSFPNLFLLYGPTTNLGHNSILFMLECQFRHILRCIDALEERGARTIEVRPEALARYDAEARERLSRTVWATVSGSWYKTETGRITNNWFGSTFEYWRRTRKPDLAAYTIT